MRLNVIQTVINLLIFLEGINEVYSKQNQRILRGCFQFFLKKKSQLNKLEWYDVIKIFVDLFATGYMITSKIENIMQLEVFESLDCGLIDCLCMSVLKDECILLKSEQEWQLFYRETSDTIKNILKSTNLEKQKM